MEKTRLSTFAAAALAAAVVPILLLASCASLVVRDTLGPEAPRGWVAFDCEFKVPVRFVHVGDGAERAFPAEDMLGRSIVTACTPGPNVFRVLIKDEESRVTVPVTAGMITYVGASMQVTTVETDWHFAGGAKHVTTTTTYYPRVRAGSHPLPFEAAAGDPDEYLPALHDQDWATRWHALRGLRDLKAALAPSWVDLIGRMSREDSSEHVRRAAGSLLGALNYPIPPHPIFVVDFSRSADGWPIGASTTAAMSLLPSGYLVEGRLPREAAWRLVEPDVAIADRNNLDIVMECSWQQGSGDGTFGVVLAGDYTTPKGRSDVTTWNDDSFLAFGISRNGRMSCTVYSQGKRAAEHQLSDNGSPPWPDTHFRIEVRKRGSRYDFAVNGTAAATFEDTTSLVIRRLGLLVANRQDVLFSRLFVYAP